MSTSLTYEDKASRPRFGDLFPLPLSTMEAFMLADARPLFPMMADLEMRFQGRIGRKAFDEALTVALERAPLFRSVAQVPRKGLAHWSPTEKEIPVAWSAEDEPLGPTYDAPLDLTREPGMRVYVRERSESSSVLLNFHHACSDGIGGFNFIEDFLAAYALACGDDSVSLRPLQPQRLLGRGALGTDGRPVYRGLLDALIGAREGARFFLQRPAPLPAIQSPPRTAADRPRTRPLLGACSEEVTAGLRRAASLLKVNVNDLLLRDLFLVLDDWIRERHGSATPRQLRILMPQNLRERDDRAMPATNMLGFAFVTRRRRLCRGPLDLLRSLSEETEAVRKGQLSRYFLGGIETLRNAGALPWVLKRDVCFSTAILTNLGDPLRRFVTRFPRVGRSLRIGNLLLQEITGAPPLRPNTRAAFCVFNSADQLKLCLRTDPYTYTSDDARALLDRYLGRLAVTAEETRRE